jgi:hypothetical protein
MASIASAIGAPATASGTVESSPFMSATSSMSVVPGAGVIASAGDQPS